MGGIHLNPLYSYTLKYAPEQPIGLRSHLVGENNFTTSAQRKSICSVETQQVFLQRTLYKQHHIDTGTLQTVQGVVEKFYNCKNTSMSLFTQTDRRGNTISVRKVNKRTMGTLEDLQTSTAQVREFVGRADNSYTLPKPALSGRMWQEEIHCWKKAHQQFATSQVWTQHFCFMVLQSWETKA